MNRTADLKRSLPQGNHAVSYCCEAASQVRPDELPTENAFEIEEVSAEMPKDAKPA